MSVIFLGGCGLFVGYGIFFLVSLPPNPYTGPPAKAFNLPTQVDDPRCYVLTKGLANDMGNLQLCYEGLEKDDILIDVTIVELDPEYAYRHRIHKYAAKDGFQLAGRSFKMQSVNGSVLELVPLESKKSLPPGTQPRRDGQRSQSARRRN